MPVLFDSASSDSNKVIWSATSASLSAQHNVSPTATNVVAIACVLWTGGVNMTSATFGVTFGGVAMVANDAAVLWDSNRSYMQWFILDGSNTGGATVPTGSRTVQATVSSVPVSGLTSRAFCLVTGTWSNVDEVGTAVVATPTSSTSNTVTVPSVLPAHRVVTAHAAGNGVSGPSGYTKTLRARSAVSPVTLLAQAGGTLLLGDAGGAASVVATATQSSTSAWGARGLSLSPVPVVAGSALQVTATSSANGGTYRTATPVMERYFEIPTAAESDLNKIAGDFVRSADGVEMPVFEKDPQDTLDYTLDWNKHIAEDDEIISVTFTPSASALVVFSTNITESLVSYRDNVATSCWFTGGVPGVNYGVVAHVVTREGRQHDRTFRVVTGQN